MAPHLLAIDQGTTSTRAIVFSAALDVVAIAQKEFPQIYPRPGWVEHDAEDLWTTTVETVREVLVRARLRAADIAALGIANQRETAVVWDRRTGRAIHNAIVWQDRRTAERCSALRARGHEDLIAAKTGLVPDSYFSATKIAWMLDHVEGARAAAIRGELAFGTVDAFLLWRLTGGRIHATDATNASRTMLYDISAGAYDPELAELLDVPLSPLPVVTDSAGDFGETQPDPFGGAVAIRGIAGDQQAAMIGQACFAPGMMKVTYGTGAFALLNTGAVPIRSRHRLLTTVAYQFAGRRTYALEGAIFVAGAAVQWLRDGLGVIAEAAETQALAEAADEGQPVYFVPAFVGLGAPHWDPDARGTVTGITRGTGRAELARAALEAVGYQTHDLYTAMQADWPGAGRTVLRVDGGMSGSNWTMQFVADVLDAPVDRPSLQETTALGAAYLAGYAAGLVPPPEEFARAWRHERRFEPRMPGEKRAKKLAGWRDAVARTRSA